MNKKFSTLLASVLFASAFSTAAYAETVDDGVSKDLKGKTVALYTAGTTDNVLAVDKDGNLVKLGAGTAFDATWDATDKDNFTNAKRALWKIASVKFDQTSGAGIYQFVNKATGAYLAINLETDNDGSSKATTKLNAAGNKNWSLTSDGVIYAYSKDSTYVLDKNTLKLVALKGAVTPSKNDYLQIGTEVDTDAEYSIKMTAAVFNEMIAQLSSDSKLHFNGTDKDVTTGQANLLTANKYVAYDEKSTSSKGFFLAEKENVTDINKNPYLLMVDTLFHNAAAGQYNKLKLDTLSVDADGAKAIKESKYKVENYAPSFDKYARPIKASIFNATYYYANDSIALSVVGVPQTISGDAEFTDGKIVVSAADQVDGYATVKDLDNEFIESLEKAVAAWYSSNSGKPKKSFASTIFQVEVTGKSMDANAETDGARKFGENTYFKISNYAATVTVVSAKGTDAGPACTEAGDGKYTAKYYRTGSELATLAQEEADDLAAASKDAATKYITSAKGLVYFAADVTKGYYYVKGYPYQEAGTTAHSAVLTELAGTRVLTVAQGTSASDLKKYIRPLIQPFTTTGGDAAITTSTKLYRIQIANTAKDAALRATADNSKYLVATGLTGTSDPKTALVESVDDANVYAQWAFIPGEAGFYQIINRGSEYSLYSGPVSKVKDANGNVVADTYVVGADTLKLAGVTVSTDIYEEKDGKFDYSGYFYAGPTKDKSYTFSIAPVAAIMNDLGAQFNKDSVMVLGDAENAPVWYFQEAGAKEYGLEIEGMTPLKYMTYKIFTKNANGDSLYVYAKNNKYYVTNKGAAPVAFALREANKGQYLFLEGGHKMTINPTPAQPVLEASDVATMRDDYFTIASASSNAYRTLTEEDGVLGNAKIFMNNEPYRYLYENTANIVANNGNAIAKDSLNFLGIYNAAASSKNAALYVDTAYVNRKDVTMPQYMFALGVEAHEATPAAACTESGVHVDKDGKPTTADKCVHATPAKKAYKTGRYLVSVADSASTAKHPAKYDGAFRLAFVDAIHVEGSDSLIIVNSKYTNNTNAIESGKATTYASKDTLKFENDKPNVATFALLIKDQADKSFYLETANKTYVRILNGVPVLTGDIENAAIFNIEATTEEATANEAIEAEGVQVIGGKGVVTVQGAAGKVITVANVLGQTIANQVAASDNVTIAVPAGIVVVAVDGEATKVVVK